jgi:hypothetical protein
MQYKITNGQITCYQVLWLNWKKLHKSLLPCKLVQSTSLELIGRNYINHCHRVNSTISLSWPRSIETFQVLIKNNSNATATMPWGALTKKEMDIKYGCFSVDFFLLQGCNEKLSYLLKCLVSSTWGTFEYSVVQVLLYSINGSNVPHVGTNII